MNKLSPRQIEVACEWWAKALAGPKFDNGEKSDRGAAMSFLAERAKPDITATQLELFRHSLSVSLERWEGEFPGLFCDYDPDPLLTAALTAAKVSPVSTALPWKTSMLFVRGGVKVSCGYASPMVDVLSPY